MNANEASGLDQAESFLSGASGIDSQAKIKFGSLMPEINQRLTCGAPYEEVLNYIFDSMRSSVPYDRIAIGFAHRPDKSLQVVWARSAMNPGKFEGNYEMTLDDASFAATFESGRPTITNNLEDYVAANPDSPGARRIVAEDLKSNLTCPLRGHGHTIGAVFFSSRHRDAYSAAHIDLFRAVADELSIVVDYGRSRELFSGRAADAQSLRTILHDLRAPLSVIQGYLDWAEEEEWYRDLCADALDFIKTVKRNAVRLSRLVEDLSELESLKLDPQRSKRAPVKLREFCDEVLKQARLLSRAKQIEISAEIGALPAEIDIDSEKIRRVLENLITNAVKFSHRGSRISLKVAQNDDRIVFAVADQGLGIPSSELPHLFKEFGKTSVAPTEGEGSTGLGLAIARRFVEEHGGRIDVVSAPGQGSTFSFWIPKMPTVE